MADTSLVMNILARDRGATETLNRVARAANGINDNVSRTNSILSRLSSKFDFAALKGKAMVGVVGAAIGTLPVIATAAAGGMVAALGGGFAAIGIAAAAQSKKVKSAFTSLKDHVVSTLQDIAAPFEPVLVRIARLAQETFDSFVPALRGAFKAMAPAIEGFAGNFADALKALIPAIGPITDAFNKLLRQLGPKLPAIFSSLADGVIAVANALRGNTGAFVNIIKFLGDLSRAMLEVIAFFTRFSTETAIAFVVAAGIIVAAISSPIAVIAALGAAIGALVSLVILNWTKVKSWTVTTWNAIKTITMAVWNIIKITIMNAVNTIRAIVVAVVNVIKTFIVASWNRIKAITVAVWNAIKFAVLTQIRIARSGVMSVVNAVVGFISGAWNRARSITVAAWNGLKSAVVSAANSMLGFVSSIPGRIVGALGDLGSLLYSAGQRVIQGLIDGIQSMFGAIGDTMSSVASSVTGFLPFSPAKRGPLRRHPPEQSGRQIARMLAEGIMDNRAAVNRAATRLAKAAGGPLGVLPELGRALGIDTADVHRFARQAAARTGIEVASASRRGEMVTVRFDVSGADEDLKRMIRKMTRVDGHGSVQQAFGA